MIGQPEYDSDNPSTNTDNTFNLLVDTGSSNEAVISRQCCAALDVPLYSCQASTTCEATSTSVTVNYVSGSWTGVLVTDIFSGAGLGVLPNIEFAQIESQKNFIQDNYQGILGLGYEALAQPSQDPPPTLLKTLVDSKRIRDVFGLLLCGVLQPLLSGTTDVVGAAGKWVLGGIEGPNGEIYSNNVLYTPLIQEKWYVVAVTDIGYDSSSLGLECSDYNNPHAIIDSGTSNLAFPSVIYQPLVAEIKAAMEKVQKDFPPQYINDAKPCCESFCDPTNPNIPLLSLPDISISVAFLDEENSDKQFTISIPPEYYWRPIVSNGIQCRLFGISEGSGIVLGDVFMDGLYVVHDRENQRVGIGTAENCPNQVTSAKTVSQVQDTNLDWCDCLSSDLKQENLVSSYWPGHRTCFFWFWWMYVVVVAFALITLSLLYVVYVWIWLKIQKKKKRSQHQAAVTSLAGQEIVSPDATSPPDSRYTRHTEQLTQRQSQTAVPVASSV